MIPQQHGYSLQKKGDELVYSCPVWESKFHWFKNCSILRERVTTEIFYFIYFLVRGGGSYEIFDVLRYTKIYKEDLNILGMNT